MNSHTPVILITLSNVQGSYVQGSFQKSGCCAPTSPLSHKIYTNYSVIGPLLTISREIVSKPKILLIHKIDCEMEPAGLALGVVGLTGQLVKVSMEWYDIFTEMSDVGISHDSALHNLRTEALRLKQWEHAWGLGNIAGSALDQNDYRYRYATASLARIVALFARVALLQSKYNEASKRSRLSDSRLLSIFRPKSPLPSPSQSRPSSPLPQIQLKDLTLLENPTILENQQLLPEVATEIISLDVATKRMQQSLPMYRKLRWVVSDNAGLTNLIDQLKRFMDGLYEVLPLNHEVLPLNLPVAGVVMATASQSDMKHFIVPCPRNTSFTPREGVYKRLVELMSKPEDEHIRIAIIGLGGVGYVYIAYTISVRNFGN